MPLYAHGKHSPQIHPHAFVAPSADVIGNVSVGDSSSIWFHTVVRGDQDKITIGNGSNIQDQTTCHADAHVPLTIGDNVTVGHNCVVHGCTIEDGCLIGMGAVVMNHARIGTGSIVAAGAVVLEGTIIPPYSLVTGSPGRVKKTYENQEEIRAGIQRASDIYVGNTREYGDAEYFRPVGD